VAYWALVAALMLQGGAAAAPGSVSGQLQMTDGSPGAAVRVIAQAAPPPNIRPTDGQNYYVSQPPVRVALTNAAGRYDLPNLPPGRYYIIAGVAGQATYYPATTDIENASVVTVEPGGSVGGIDFKLLTSPGSRVRGRVTPPPAADLNERAILSGVNLGELIEVPVRGDGTFEFGRVPRGSYLLSLYPAPPGLASLPFRLGDQDVDGLQFTRPPVRTVSGRIVVENGPLPRSFLAFVTPQDHVSGTVLPDGTFTAKLHQARHEVALGGLPVGYAIGSVRAGSEDVTTQGFLVRDADVTGLVITVRTPRQLPRLRGRVTATDVPASSVAQITGPVNGTLSTPLRADGSFEFPALPPGMYRLTIPALPQVPATNVVVDAEGADVQLATRR
jgi:hypothetical protein